MSIPPRQTYQIYHNKLWIESLENKEISHYDVDHLENQWVVYKDKYTTALDHIDRLQTQKNRAGDVLIRNKNMPFGFKLADAASNDLDNAARKNQASVVDPDLRNILDGNVYEFKLYGDKGVVFGKSGSDFYSIAFLIDGTINNSYEETFMNIQVLNKIKVESLYNYIDSLIIESYFYTLIYSDAGDPAIRIVKYNLITNSYDAFLYHPINFGDLNQTSLNDLTGLIYPPVDSREIFIGSSYVDSLRRIWTTTYKDGDIYLAYECAVPTARANTTGVTEGIVLLQIDLDLLLSSSNGELTAFVFDTVESISKLSEEKLCQAFIPDFDDTRKSFGSSMTINDRDLIVGSYKENSIYVFDLDEADTPAIYDTDFPILSTNGIKIEKDYSLEYTAIYPIRMNAGTMDFEVFGGTGIKWIRENGDYVVDSRPGIVLSNAETIYLVMDSFKDSVTIDGHSTTGFIGNLNEVPDINFGLKLNDTAVSGYFNDGISLTDIDLERTNLTQEDLEQCMIVLHEAGNYNGTILAEDAMPEITNIVAVGAVNSLLAKGWNVSINMPFTNIDPSLSITATIESGELMQIYSSEDQMDIIAELFGGVFNTVSVIDDVFGTFGSIVTGTYASGTI